VPGSLAKGAEPALIMPADCKAPEMAWEITAVRSVVVNCEVDTADDDSGRAMQHSLLGAVLQELPVLVFLLPGAWKLG